MNLQQREDHKQIILIKPQRNAVKVIVTGFVQCETLVPENQLTNTKTHLSHKRDTFMEDPATCRLSIQKNCGNSTFEEMTCFKTKILYIHVVATESSCPISLLLLYDIGKDNYGATTCCSSIKI